MAEWWPIILFLGTIVFLASGFPVAFTLSGSALLIALLGTLAGDFDEAYLMALPERIYGIMINETLIAIPLFIFMGVTLERSKLSDELLNTMARLFGSRPGGLGISVCLVGGLLAASTGIVGATVVTMGLISLPAMLGRCYSPKLATGVICASGTLGQIIPPSIVLVILGDVIATAHQQAQLEQGIFNPTTVSVGDLFVGALVPGVLLMGMYILYVAIYSLVYPHCAPPASEDEQLDLKKSSTWVQLFRVLLPPFLLILGVLGSILTGIATPTEAASVGCGGALLLAKLKGQLNLKVLREVMRSTTEVNGMVFAILLGASVFSLVFRGFEGDEWVRSALSSFEGGVATSFLIVMAVMFLMGFFLDFFEITFVVVPIVGPILLAMGLDPIWLGVMIALNLQTSFLTPPFGFSLFYLRGVAPKEIQTKDIYYGVIPFILIQVFLLVLLWYIPGLATWLPGEIFGQAS